MALVVGTTGIEASRALELIGDFSRALLLMLARDLGPLGIFNEWP